MSSAISPHDATAKNEAGLSSKFFGAVWNVVAYPFITHGELKWATGILSIDDDFETCTIPLAIIHNSAFCHSLSVHNANACLVCTLPYVTAKMVTDINDGFNVCSIPQEQISRVMKQWLSLRVFPAITRLLFYCSSRNRNAAAHSKKWQCV